jgi:thiol-disulfide isomerase/thioredoxin
MKFTSPGTIFLSKYFILILSCLAIESHSQTAQLLKFDDLQTSVQKTNDTLYVLNFWATWCKPCIEELPGFEKINEEYKDARVKMILVNLDFNSKVDSSVIPFLSRKKIKSGVVHITDTDPNEWINKIDEKWSGAIPATVIYKNGKQLFFKEGSMTYDEIKKVIENNLN